MTEFEQEAIAYFRRELPQGYYQAEDGVAVFSQLPRYWFWRYRLRRMVKRGLLRTVAVRSIWRSYNGTPAYGLAPELYDGTEPTLEQLRDNG